jgi:hypothetical protein
MAAKQQTFRPTASANIVDEVKALQAQYEAKRGQAIEALLDQKKEIEQTLQSLGWVPPTGTRSVRRTKPVSQRFCKICGTTGSHDARAHKNQGAKKRPFTPEELADL